MANTTIHDVNVPGGGNRLVRYTQDINREYVRENMFSAYMGEELTSIIRIRNELKAGGELINLPIVTRLKAGIILGTGTANNGQSQLAGAEEIVDNFGQRVKVDWARNAVVTTKIESQKDSADIFGEAKPLLSDWGKELQRDEIIAAMMALPSESIPAAGVRVNGTLFEAATIAQQNTFLTDNSDRIQFGSVATPPASFLLGLQSVDATNDKLTGAALSLLKRKAKTADPHIRPFKTNDGYDLYVAFTGSMAFRDLKNDPVVNQANRDARAREGNGMNKNPIFMDGDLLWDGVIVREVPEITNFVTARWNANANGGTIINPVPSGIRVEPVFLCGQQAITLCWGQMARPTFLKEDDYQLKTGVGVDMCFGTAKIFKKHPHTGTRLVQMGMATGFFAGVLDL